MNEEELEKALAASWHALEEAPDALPDTLRRKVSADAERFFDIQRPPTSKSSWLGWSLAAALAASLLFVLVPESTETPTDLYAELQALSDSQTIVWAKSEHFPDAHGQVVWNTARQEGYLELSGVPVNAPAQAQYQLWIVDPSRDEKPVDGGVFDIPAGAEPVIIPIDAKLPISEPVLFAVTREKPGGVVVSGGPLLLVTERNL
ncbi:MAG: anti-sigma factor [Myxococcota bacterium]